MLFSAVAGSRPGELVLQGEIDMSVTDQLAALLARAADEGQPTLDVGGVTFMDSSGLNVLIQAAAARNGSPPIIVHNVHGLVRRLFEVALPRVVPGLELWDDQGVRLGASVA
jgi:anti-anti-sigma factor